MNANIIERMQLGYRIRHFPLDVCSLDPCFIGVSHGTVRAVCIRSLRGLGCAHLQAQHAAALKCMPGCSSCQICHPFPHSRCRISHDNKPISLRFLLEVKSDNNLWLGSTASSEWTQTHFDKDPTT